ncbi:MAG: hypothetical protein HC921_02860 [Synechococcaceae cyanobacterium SM2_3_1]|nr:hypothetical protein [Synechococcaceae cyanobacterium SM2_3_1]
MAPDLQQQLPTSAELPSSDDTPVDNEDQNFVPNLLLFLLEEIWKHRQDWYFGVDMGIYHTTGISPHVPIVPDGFLSLGVPRRRGNTSRLSYVVWEEQNIVPTLVIEVASLTPGGEYDRKLESYARLGVKYYLIYNPSYWQWDRHLPFEMYRLEEKAYELQVGEPYWMPEVGLGMGRGQYRSGDISREVLYWFDQQGKRYLTAQEKLEAAEALLQHYQQKYGDLPETTT